MRLKNFLLVVEDIERSRKFYKDLFGLEVVRDFDGNMILTEGLVLQERKIWEKFIDKTVEYRGHNAELYFEERNLDDFLKRVWESEWAVELVHPITTHSWGQRVLRVYDPDGHMIEVGEPMQTMPEVDEDTAWIEENDWDENWDEGDEDDEDDEEPPTELNIGDVFEFGRYWYSANLAFGKQGIAWRVLDKKDGKLLVLSNWALDARAYHDRQEAVTWEDCELRAWLNGSFMDSAFRWDERRLIERAGGEDGDQIFLLSKEEFDLYWLVMEENWNTAGRWGASTMATPYAVARGAVGDEVDELDYETQTLWWMRQAEGAADAVSLVDEHGLNGGRKQVTTIGAVRPAMWVKEAVIEKAENICVYEEMPDWDEREEEELS